MKKKITVVVLTMVLLCIFTGCMMKRPTTVTNKTETILDKLYKTAVDLGFEGTLQEFIATVSGKDGVGIDKIYLNGDELVVCLSDGETMLLGNIKGNDGKNGADGIGIKRIYINSKKEFIIETSDGKVNNYGSIMSLIDAEELKGEKGEQGEDGEKGEQGETGRGVEKIIQTEGGYIIVKYTDGTEEVLGQITASDGKDGENGNDGKDGTNGLSAYEIYVKYHPEYTKSEAEWIEDYVSGKLIGDVVVKHKVTVICGGNTYTYEITEGETIDLTEVDTFMEGYTFKGWISEGKEYNFDQPIKGEITIKAEYEKTEEPIIPENPDEPQNPDKQEVTYDDEMTEIWEEIEMEAMHGRRITVSGINASALKSLVMNAGKGIVKITIYGEEDVVYDTREYDTSEGIIEYEMLFGESEVYYIDISYISADVSDVLSITPMF